MKDKDVKILEGMLQEIKNGDINTYSFVIHTNDGRIESTFGGNVFLLAGLLSTILNQCQEICHNNLQKN